MRKGLSTFLLYTMCLKQSLYLWRKNIRIVCGKECLILNPEKRNVMVVKNEMRFFYQKRNVLQI